jgi:hypothetical protein
MDMLIKALSVLAMIASVVSAGYAVISYTQSRDLHKDSRLVVQRDSDPANNNAETNGSAPRRGNGVSPRIEQHSTGQNSPNVVGGRDVIIQSM